jgi:hypothetical protein
MIDMNNGIVRIKLNIGFLLETTDGRENKTVGTPKREWTRMHTNKSVFIRVH